MVLLRAVNVLQEDVDELEVYCHVRQYVLLKKLDARSIAVFGVIMHAVDKALKVQVVPSAVGLFFPAGRVFAIVLAPNAVLLTQGDTWRLSRLVQIPIGVQTVVHQETVVWVFEVKEKTEIVATHVEAKILRIHKWRAQLAVEIPRELFTDDRLVRPQAVEVHLLQPLAPHALEISTPIEANLEVSLVDEARGITSPAHADVRVELTVKDEGSRAEASAIE